MLVFSLLIVNLELLALTQSVKNCTPFDIKIIFESSPEIKISAKLSPNSELKQDFTYNKIKISGIKTSANAFFGGDGKATILESDMRTNGKYPNFYFVTSEIEVAKNGLSDQLRPQRIRFFLVGCVSVPVAPIAQAGLGRATIMSYAGIYDTSSWFSGTTGLAEEKVTQSAPKEGDWIVRNHTPFTVNVELNIRNANGLRPEVKNATIAPNSEYKNEDKDIQVESFMLNGIKTVTGTNYFGGSQKVTILKQTLSGSEKPKCTGGTTWDIFTVFLGAAAPGLPLSMDLTKVKFMLTLDKKTPQQFEQCRLGDPVIESPWYDAKTGL